MSDTRDEANRTLHDGADEHRDPLPVTVLEVACYRLGRPTTGTVSAGELEAAGFPIIGGCAVCGATIAAYNACPSRSGYWKCANGCIGDDGWLDAETCGRDLEASGGNDDD